MAATEKQRIVLQLLKEDRDAAIEKYKNETDELLKDIFLEDVKNKNLLYKNKMKEFVDGSNQYSLNNVI